MKKLDQMLPWAALVLCVCLLILPNEVQAAGKTVSASISSDTVKIGKAVTISATAKGVSYQSSDTSTATVSQDGRVTGKKAGTAVISVKKSGYGTKRFTVTVKKNGTYPAIPVTLDEIRISTSVKKSSLSASIANRGKAGTVRRIIYQYEAVIYQEAAGTESVSPAAVDAGKSEPVYQKETKTIKLEAKNIAAGKSQKLTVKGSFGDPEKIELTLKKVSLYTGKLLLTYSVQKGTFTTAWGVKDTAAPVITGWVGKNSYNSKDVYMVAYPDKKYDFTKYVTAVDDRDGAVKVKADTSRINWKKKGTYKVVFSASDQAGNTARKTANVQVRTVSSLDQMADSILARIIKDSWSDQVKAEAIYRYVRKNYSYVDSNDHASWENSALYGLRYRSGNCFVFYSVSRLLLTRAGIPNIEVKRSAGSTHGHWWNYVYVKGGWYHFDTTPRRIQAVYCLVTDAQLTAYSNAAGNSHIWDKSLLPKGAVKQISKVVWGKRY